MTDSYAACTATLPHKVPTNGLVVEASSVTGDAWFGFKTSTDHLIVFRGPDGKLRLANKTASFGNLPYDAVSMRWWRLRPDSDKFVAEYSGDGQDWRLLGETDLYAVDAEYWLYIGAGIAMQPPPQVATFEAINVCD